MACLMMRRRYFLALHWSKNWEARRTQSKPEPCAPGGAALPAAGAAPQPRPGGHRRGRAGAAHRRDWGHWKQRGLVSWKFKKVTGTSSCGSKPLGPLGEQPHNNELEKQNKNHCSNFDNETDSLEGSRVILLLSRASKRSKRHSALG